MNKGAALITFWLTIAFLFLCSFLVYVLAPYKEVIAQALLKGLLVVGALLLLVLLAVAWHLVALLRHLKQRRELELIAQAQALQLERERHELDRHVALTRVPADLLGNYPVLIDIAEERLTFLPTGNFVQAVPHTYAPRIDHRSPKDLLAGASITPEDAPPLVLPAPKVPTLVEQLQRGDTLPYEAESILGYHRDGVPRRGPWHQLHSFSVFGGSGSGKSSTVSYYAALAVLHGARLLVIDPDAEEDDSISQRLSGLAFAFLCPIGDTPARAAKVLEVAERELATPADYPVVWVSDELSSIMRAGEKGLKGWGELAQRLALATEDWAQRGRKRRRTTIMIGQISKASRTGGTELKYSMTATFVHRLHAQQARLVLDGPDAKQCPYLAVGEVMVLLNTSPETYRMHIPYADPAAMQLVADLMAAGHHTRHFTTRFDLVSGRRFPAPSEGVNPTRNTLETDDETAWQAKVKRVRALRLQGCNQKHLLWQVWGVTPGGSADYAQARAEYQQILTLLNTEQANAESEGDP